MASTYTGLGTELMVTGEAAGTWGTKTNTNLKILEQISGGYVSIACNTTGATTLAVADGTVGDTNQVGHRILNLTAALAGNVTVTIPLDVQTFYIIKNSTTNSYTVEFKYVTGSGSSVTWAVNDKSTKIIYATANDGTNPDIVDAGSGFSLTSPNLVTGMNDVKGNELFKVTATGSAVNEFTIANAAAGNGPTLSSTGSSDSNIDINITPKGTGDVVLAADTVSVGDAAAAATLRSNGAGTLTVTTGGTTDLILSTNNGTASGTITITDAANGAITLAPNGTGIVDIQGSMNSSLSSTGKALVMGF